MTFFKRVNPRFWSKNGHFSNFLFLGNIGQGNVFYDILEPKNTFLDYKNTKFKSRIIDIFPNGLTHGVNAKMAIFPTFFFRQYRPGKFVLRYSRTKKDLSRLSKHKVQKVKKLTFFQRVNPCFWSKNGHYSNFFF